MRFVGACLVGVAAFAAWMWVTGPGTSLLLAIPGWIIGFIAARAFWVLTKPRGDQPDDTAPSTPPGVPPEPPFP